MTTDHILALLSKLEKDEELRKKLRGASDLHAVEAIAVEAGYAITRADWLRHQAMQLQRMNDEELEHLVDGLLVSGWGLSCGLRLRRRNKNCMYCLAFPLLIPFGILADQR